MRMFFVGLAIGFFAGGITGIFTAALILAGRNDEDE